LPAGSRPWALPIGVLFLAGTAARAGRCPVPPWRNPAVQVAQHEVVQLRTCAGRAWARYAAQRGGPLVRPPRRQPRPAQCVQRRPSCRGPPWVTDGSASQFDRRLFVPASVSCCTSTAPPSAVRRRPTRSPRTSPTAGPPTLARNATPDPTAGAGVFGQPVRKGPGLDHAGRVPRNPPSASGSAEDSVANSRSRSTPELQGRRTALLQRLPVPRPAPQGRPASTPTARVLTSSVSCRFLHHGRQVRRANASPNLALHPRPTRSHQDVPANRRSRTHLGRRLLADPGDAGQVVRRVTSAARRSPGNCRSATEPYFSCTASRACTGLRVGHALAGI